MSAAAERARTPSRIAAPLTWIGAAAAACLSLLVVAVPLSLSQQWAFGLAALAGAYLIARDRSRRATVVVAVLSMLVSTRYIVWRTTATLEFDTLPSFLLGSGLYLAELYAWVILALGFLQTSFPLERTVVEPEGAPDEWPTVDVFVPTYNESLDIVRRTVFAAMDMDYPRGRFRVFILDDGRRPEFQAFARAAGCGYLTRADNRHAKAGNLNAAMRKTEGELIAIFDCDHVPTRAFLQLTVGWFQKDPKLALIQTPHHFYSPDPVQRNLAKEKELPGEGDLFYGAVQKGNDLWNATFFCGSCAVIRRTALESTNGFAGETVTEDAHTALKLQRMGWNTAYLGARLSAGLATERLVLHIGQRIRWARGMTQIFRIDNPLLGPGLKMTQRLCYLNAMLHFQFPLPRIVFLTSPLCYLILGQNIIAASASLIFAYALPHLFISMLSSERIQGGSRRPFWGEIYETLLAFHLVKPTVLTLLQPRKGKFNVTDKGSLLDHTYFDWRTVRPHLITAGLLAGGIVLGFVKLLFFPDLFNVQADTLLLNTAWAVFSLLILIAAVSVAGERRQVRQHIRIDSQMPATLYFADGYVVEGTTSDISVGGLAVRLPAGFDLRDRKVTDVSIPMGDDTLTLPVDTVRMESGAAQVRFLPLERERERLLVRAILGRADAWQPAEELPVIAGLKSLGDIVSVDVGAVGRALRVPTSRRRRTPAKAAAAALLALLLAAPQMSEARTATLRADGHAPAASTASPLDGVSRQRISLQNLRVEQPVRLAGTRGEIGIPFGLRANQVVTEAALTLSYAHSPSLLGDLSQLVVILNGEVIRSIPLSDPRGADQRVQVPINPALFLPGSNQLNIRLIGHYSRDCEDPFHSSLWANISNRRSFLDLKVQALPLAPDLARLPQPFFDQSDPMPLRLPFVFAGPPTDSELEAAASLASWFGALASYRTFSFPPAFGELPRGDGIVLVTPQRTIPGLDVEIDGPAVAAMKNPSNAYANLLVVMGRDDRELKLAAAALPSGRGVYTGTKVSVDGVRIPSFPRYSAPRWLRTDRPVQLGEIVDPFTLQGRGLPPGPLSAGFRVPPDLFFWPREGARLELSYRYPSAPWLDRRSSRLDVSMNNQYLRTLPLQTGSWWESLGKTARSGSHTSRASMVLPHYIMFGQNQLVFDYNLMIANKKRCEGTLPDNVRVSILPESRIDLTRAYNAVRMPDLATFANAGYPFTVRPDLAETAAVLPKSLSPATVEAFLGLMGRFGDSTGAAVTALDVVRSADPEALAGRDVIVLGGLDMARGGEGQLFEPAPVHYQEGRLRVVQRSPVERAFRALPILGTAHAAAADDYVYGTRNFSGITSFESPFESGRTVIALLSSEPVQLAAMVDGLSNLKINTQVQGDLSVVDGDGMASFAMGDRYWAGDLPFWVHIAFWFSEHPLLLALSGIAVAFAVAGPVYALLKRQERRRLVVGEHH